MSTVNASEAASLRRDDWEASRRALEQEFGERVTLDQLSGTWSIFQRARGHRHSIDDVLTAAYALEVSAAVTRCLDLGTGIGSVGLLVLWALGPAASLTAIEAQTISYRLLLANVAGNRVSERVSPLLGDLREMRLDGTFPLITGSPPYFPANAGIVPQDLQKAHARFELRGDVSDYARAAKRHLAPNGHFVFCFPTPQKQRALTAAAEAGLHVVRWRDVIPRAGLAPLFSLFDCQHEEHSCQLDPPLVVRDRGGELSAAMQSVRQRFGFG